MENDQEPRGPAAGDSIKSWTQATQKKQEGLDQAVGPSSCRMEEGSHPVVWKEDYSTWHKKLFCPNCYHDVRVDLVLGIRHIDEIMVPYYTCKMCGCQFTRKPRFEDIYDKEGRI